jgi:hypothetical protein
MPVLHHRLQLDALHAQRQWIRSFSSPSVSFVVICILLAYLHVLFQNLTSIFSYIFIYFLITNISQYTVSI